MKIRKGNLAVTDTALPPPLLIKSLLMRKRKSTSSHFITEASYNLCWLYISEAFIPTGEAFGSDV